MRSLTPEGLWLGAKEQAKEAKLTLAWLRLTLSIVLKNSYQDKNVAPLIKLIRTNKQLFHNHEVVGHLLAFLQGKVDLVVSVCPCALINSSFFELKRLCTCHT